MVKIDSLEMDIELTPSEEEFYLLNKGIMHNILEKVAIFGARHMFLRFKKMMPKKMRKMVINKIDEVLKSFE